MNAFRRRRKFNHQQRQSSRPSGGHPLWQECLPLLSDVLYKKETGPPVSFFAVVPGRQ